MKSKVYLERCIYQYQKKNGTTVFYVEVRKKDSKKTLTKVCKTITDARRWLRVTETDIEEGKEIFDSKARKRTLNDLIEEYKRIHLNKFPRRLKDQTAHLNWWSENYGAKPLIAIKPSLLAEAKDRLLNGITPRKINRTNSTVNRYLSTLSKAFTLASREWQWIVENPFKRISKLRENPSRTRFLSREEFKMLLEECKKSRNPHLYGMVLIAGVMGLRFTEVASLRFKHIDFENRFVTLEMTKNGDTRIVFLPDQVHDYLITFVNRNQEEYLFPSKNPEKRHPYSMIRKAFKNALQTSGIKDFRYHDLRHTCASHLAMSGATQGALMKVLGHRSPTMTAKYAHYSDSHIAQVMQKSSNYLLNSKE